MGTELWERGVLNDTMNGRIRQLTPSYPYKNKECREENAKREECGTEIADD